MALTIWRDDFLSDVIIPLVDASLQLMELDRTGGGGQANMEMVESVAHCLGKTCPLSVFLFFLGSFFCFWTTVLFGGYYLLIRPTPKQPTNIYRHTKHDKSSEHRKTALKTYTADAANVFHTDFLMKDTELSNR